MRMNGKEAYYAVAIGRRPGIFRTWQECHEQVYRFPNGKFKKFFFREAAEQFINDWRKLTNKRAKCRSEQSQALKSKKKRKMCGNKKQQQVNQIYNNNNGNRGGADDPSPFDDRLHSLDVKLEKCQKLVKMVSSQALAILNDLVNAKVAMARLISLIEVTVAAEAENRDENFIANPDAEAGDQSHQVDSTTNKN